MRALRMLAVSLALAQVVWAAPPSRRLSQHIEETFKSLTAARAFDSVLPKGWQIEEFGTTADRVELTFSDAAGQQHAVELLLEAPQGTSVAGRGQFFYFRLGHGADDPGDARALLLAAGIVDSATTQEAFVPEDAPLPTSDPNHLDIPSSLSNILTRLSTIPTIAALALGAIQTLIVVGAIVLAIVLPIRRRANVL